MAFVSAEGGFGDAISPHSDLMVVGAEVQLGKNDWAMELVDDRDGVLVFNRLLVKSLIIDA
jgi:hypothetical protein